MSFIEGVLRSLRTSESVTISQKDVLDSVQRSHDRGIYAAEYDYLGVLFGTARLDKKMTVDELSKTTGVGREDIIDLEAASFHLREAVEVAAKLRGTLGIKMEDYRMVLVSSICKK